MNESSTWNGEQFFSFLHGRFEMEKQVWTDSASMVDVPYSGNVVESRGYIQLTPEDIDRMADESADQGEYVIALYKHVFPLWDDIDHIMGWPKVSKNTARHILRHLTKEPRLGPLLGQWFNSGFSASESMATDWVVSVEGICLEFKSHEK